MPPDPEQEKIERLRRAMYSRKLSEKLKEKPRRHLEGIRPVVGEDWQRPEPKLSSSIVAPKTLQLMRSALWWLLVAAIVFFLAAMIFFAYYFTLGGGASPASPRNIDIVITGPTQIAGGEPTQLQVTVTNRNRVTLELAELVITYPPGTRSPVDFSTDLSSQRISLGTIESGGRRQGTVSAVFAGGGSEPAVVGVELEYRLQGSNSVFVASEEYSAIFSASALSVSVEGNIETIAGQPVEMTVTVSSNAPAPVRDVLLSASFPFGFAFRSATPQQARAGIWELGDFAPGQRREITIRGVLTGEENDERIFRFSAGTRKEPGNDAIEAQLAEGSFAMRIAEPFLGLSVMANGRSGQGLAAAPGETVTVVVGWENNLSTAVTDAVIVARLSGVQIDGETVKSTTGFFRSTDGSMFWDKTTTAGTLANIPAGSEGTVSFSFEMPDADTLDAISNPSLTITINAAGKRASEGGVPENLQATAVQRIGLASALTLDAQGLYYANPFGSTGPLPPKAEEETTYAIVFTLTNTTNEIRNAKLTATLPTYVRWVGIYSPASETISFNQDNGTFIWDVGILEAGVGVGGTLPKQAAIAIGFTPSTSQIGQSPVLLQSIALTGTDAATGEAVSKSVPNVTTNIAGDPGFSSTQGTVVR